MTTGSHRNVWAYNSFTHGGDGLFLATLNGGFDGQGVLHEEGTCDDNEFAFTDGSYSTANAFESTFSRNNVFYKNWANESNYGFWRGFSKANLLEGNEINGSHADAIATEHGPGNVYIDNDIERTGGVAIHLWAGTGPRSEQSPSKGNVIVGNRIVKAGRAYDLTNSTETATGQNVVKDAPIPEGFQPGTVPTGTPPSFQISRLKEIMALKPAGFKMYRDTDLPKGWEWLAPSPYGMRDYRGMEVPWMMRDAKTLRAIVRPEVVKSIRLPDWMVMTPGATPAEKFITTKPSGRPYGEYRDFAIKVIGKDGIRQNISGHVLDLEWKVRWFKWFRNDHDAYKDTAGWAALFAGPAIREDMLPDLPAIPGYSSPVPGLPPSNFALDATTKVKLNAGRYRFDSISDDGIEVFVDGKAVISNWTHHGGTGDAGEVVLSAGIHDIEVHYCQEDGAAALSVHWTRLSGG